MMIQGLVNQFKNEHQLRHGRVERSAKTYNEVNVERFIKAVNSGVTIVKAASDEGIPIGSAFKHVPENLKKKRNKPKALELAKQRANGLIDMTTTEIAKRTHYSRAAINKMIEKIKSGHVYED